MTSAVLLAVVLSVGSSPKLLKVLPAAGATDVATTAVVRAETEAGAATLLDPALELFEAATGVHVGETFQLRDGAALTSANTKPGAGYLLKPSRQLKRGARYGVYSQGITMRIRSGGGPATAVR
jgi:hypothetical protein